MAAPFLATYRDAIEHLRHFAGGALETVEVARLRMAVQAGYRDVGYDRRWRYLKRHERITLNAPYSTGTVAFDLTGGATAEYQLTLSDGAWPTWARYGRIIIDDVIYKIAERYSDTVVSLDPTFSPSADVAAGETYTLMRSVYNLPGTMWQMGEIHDENNWWSGTYVTPEEWLLLERNTGGSNEPFSWTIMGAPDLYGALALCVYGYPSTTQTADFICTVSPREMKFDGFTKYSSDSVGTMTDVTGTTVTLSNVDPGTRITGSMIRFSDDANCPTGHDGSNPYAAQRIITARASANTYTIDSSVANKGIATADGTGYHISDPVDLPPYLFNYFLRAIEREWIIISRSPGLKEAERLLRDEQMLCYARDKTTPTEGVASGTDRNAQEWWSVPINTISIEGAVS